MHQDAEQAGAEAAADRPAAWVHAGADFRLRVRDDAGAGLDAEAEGEAVMWPELSKRDVNVVLAVASLGAFWYFLRRVEPQPKWIRWATWW